MRAELLKVRSMPLPFWCGVAIAVCALLGFAATWKWGLGPDLSAFDIAIGFPLAIASIVFGVWVFGVEYGQNTLRRTLTADPRRLRLFAFKFIVALAFVTLVTVIVHLIALPFYDIAADRHGESISLPEFRDVVITSLIGNLAYAIVGGSLALITASVAGGVTAALVFIFIADTVLGIIPDVGDYSLGVALADLLVPIRDSQEGFVTSDHSVAEAGAILAAWLIGLAGLGWLRLWRSDVK